MNIRIIFVFSFILLLYVTNCTLLLHPKPRKDLLNKPYTKYPDLSIKKEGNKNLVIALHGMYSYPETFREFGDIISSEGWDLYAPVLPNSAYSAEDLRSQEIYQWEEILQAAFHKIVTCTEGYDKIVLLGHSQGGAAALTLAPSLGFITGLAVVAAPLHMINKKNSLLRKLGVPFSGFCHFILPGHGASVDSVPANKKEDLASIEDTRGGDGFFYGLTVHSMSIGLRKMRPRLKLIDLPLFLAYEKNDKTVAFSDFLELKSKVSSQKISESITETPLELHPFSKKHRLFSYKPVKDKLFTELKNFLKELE